MVKSLHEELREYGNSDAYPFHMPGHKRNIPVAGVDTSLDITEITGFDDLHFSRGILKAAQDEAAESYGAMEAFYLVNGSTVGILSAIFAVLPEGAEVIIDRSCHRSVYHAAMLRKLVVHYVDKPWISPGITGCLSTSQLKNSLIKHPDVKAVVITSAGYDGVVDNVEGLSEVIHEHGATLICDEAHGAHFGFSSDFPQTAVRKGADIVITSLHKTLPAFTQSALLMNNRPEFSENIRRYLRVFETSSPSYMLMAGISDAVRLMRRQGESLLKDLKLKIENLYKKVADNELIRILTKEEALAKGSYDYDMSRLVFMCDTAGITGKMAFEILSREYCIELEMSDPWHMTAIASVADTDEGFDRLADAINDIEKRAAGGEFTGSSVEFPVFPVGHPKAVMSMSEAFDSPYHIRNPKDAVGEISAGFVYTYPPGSPIVAPGELINDDIPERIGLYEAAGMKVCGAEEGLKTVAADKRL